MHYYEVGTLADDGWAVTFGTPRRGLAGRNSPRPLLTIQIIVLIIGLILFWNSNKRRISVAITACTTTTKRGEQNRYAGKSEAERAID